MRMYMRPATQYVLRFLVKGNTFSFMGRTNFLFSSVCVPIWYYIYDAWQAYNSPSPLQHTACSYPEVKAATTGIIPHFSFFAVASLYSSPGLNDICLSARHVRVQLSAAQRALLCAVVERERVPTLVPFLAAHNFTQMCALMHVHLLILPPILSSISLR